MLKLTIKVKEHKNDCVSVELKQISQKEFDSSTQSEKIMMSEIKTALESLISKLNNMKEGE